MKKSLSGETIIITGAASGFGKTEAHYSASRGAKVSPTSSNAAAALFLASDETSFIASAELCIDGGMSQA